MTKRFGLRPGLSAAYLPKLGKVSPGRVIVGGDNSRFCPDILIELQDSPLNSVTLGPITEPVVIIAETTPIAPIAAAEVAVSDQYLSLNQNLSKNVSAVVEVQEVKRVSDDVPRSPSISENGQDGATASEMLESEMKRGRGRPKKKMF